MPEIEAIVFDFDGVVVDSEPLYELAEIELFKSFGVKINIEDLKDTKGLPEDRYLSIIRSRYNLNATLDELKTVGRRILKKIFTAELKYIPGFIDFYTKICRYYKTGLATSSSRSLMDWIYKNTKIKNHFQESVTADDVNHSKPLPEPYLQICRMLAVKPKNTIVIEDSINGLRSARSAGTVTIALKGSATPIEISDADYMASNYGEIETLLTDITAGRKPK